MGIKKHKNEAIRELLVEHDLSGGPQHRLERRQYYKPSCISRTGIQIPTQGHANMQDEWHDRTLTMQVCLAHR